MESKLTLTLEKKTIEKGKAYARKKRTSLSKLVEKYIDKITAKQEPEKSDKKEEAAAFLKKISLPAKNKHWDHKKEYTRYLIKKYK
ncbi:DUF6364 family protein [Ohtaekwangia sp.]|uniref:DUF6364 family protein n=1 Tax=Ohtaekwangia sp. TaxID=2066019 RepID=UPI002F9264E0